jgi:methyl-accepting chemotaxis protein
MYILKEAINGYYFSDINDNTIELTQMINDINTEMITMTNGISEKTKDIQRVQKTPGSNNAIYIRNIAQKVAEIMNKYSDKMEPFNRRYVVLWNKIETSYLGILNNKNIFNAEDIKSLQDNKKQLEFYIDTTYSLKKSSENMIESMNGIIGMERRLNKAASRLTLLYQEFINNLETTMASADRIIERINFLSNSLK